MGKSLSIAEETKIIALLARGDTYPQIRAHFQAEHDRNLSAGAIMNVKERNIEALNAIKEKTLRKQQADALAIKGKANAGIDALLDNNNSAAEVLAKAAEQYMNEEIGLEEYTKLVKTIKTASLTELVNVSKAMHEQSSSGSDPEENAENLAAIRKALEESDEVELARLVFKKNGQSQNIH